MNLIDLQAAAVEELITNYKELAARHTDATESGNHVAGNKAHDGIASIYRELRARGHQAQLALLPLVDDGHPGVRVLGCCTRT